MGFSVNPEAFGEVLKGPEATKAFEAAAAEIAQAAQDAAPVRTGAYRDGIEVQSEDGNVSVVASDWKSAILEFGNRNGGPLNILTGAAESLGYKIVGGRR